MDNYAYALKEHEDYLFRVNQKRVARGAEPVTQSFTISRSFVQRKAYEAAQAALHEARIKQLVARRIAELQQDAFKRLKEGYEGLGLRLEA